MIFGVEYTVIIELLLVAISLAMDAFAVSVSKGLSSINSTLKTALVCGLWFGAFQFIMPILGWLAGSAVLGFIKTFGRIVGCVLLGLIGCNMIRESFSSDDDNADEKDCRLDVATMFAAALATSIDALFVGVTYAALQINIILASSTIGIVAFLISCSGCLLGNKIGNRFERGATLAGGIILILIGLKILFF